MRGLFSILIFLLMLISLGRNYQAEKIIESITNEHPGLHASPHIPPIHSYLNREMYKYLNDSTASVTVINDVPLSYGISGVTYYIKNGTYVILLRWSKSEPMSDYTLLHEWGHVIQMHNRELVDYGNGNWKWREERVDFSIPWGLRPWEIQADSIALYHQNRLLPFRNYEPLR